MEKIQPSGTLSVNAKVLQKRQKGETVYHFAAGDPVLLNHPCITQSALKYIQKGESHYPLSEGIPELRELASQWLNATCKTNTSKNHVTITPGGKFAIYALLYTLLEPDDEVLFASPYWVSYPDVTKIAGGKPKIVSTTAESHWKLSPEHILKAVTKKTKVLLFNNACNPTGTLYTRQEVKAILDAAKEAGLFVVSDEVYSGLVHAGEFVSCGSFPEHESRVSLVQSCSKNFAMAGWRIGFAIASEEITKRLKALMTQTTSGCATATQWAAVGALEHYEEVNGYVKQAMQKRRDCFYDTFDKLFTKLERPQSGIYAFVPLTLFGKKGETTSIAFCERAIDEANVAIVPGLYFGSEGFVRFAFSDTEESIAQGLLALAKWASH